MRWRGGGSTSFIRKKITLNLERKKITLDMKGYLILKKKTKKQKKSTLEC